MGEIGIKIDDFFSETSRVCLSICITQKPSGQIYKLRCSANLSKFQRAEKAGFFSFKAKTCILYDSRYSSLEKLCLFWERQLCSQCCWKLCNSGKHQIQKLKHNLLFILF